MNNTITIFLNAAKTGNVQLLTELAPNIENNKIYNKALELALKNNHKNIAKMLYRNYNASSYDLVERMIKTQNYNIEKYLKYCNQECIDEIFIKASKYGLANILSMLMDYATERAKRLAFLKAIKLDQISSITMLLSSIQNKKILVDGLMQAVDIDSLAIVKYLIYHEDELIEEAYYYSSLKGKLDIFMYLYFHFPKTKDFYNELYEYAAEDIRLFLSDKIL